MTGVNPILCKGLSGGPLTLKYCLVSFPEVLTLAGRAVRRVLRKVLNTS